MEQPYELVPLRCPACDGPWLRNFVFKHVPTSCRLLPGENATQYADFERLGQNRRFTRTSTPAELELYALFALEPVREGATEVFGHPSSRRRIVNGIDPDMIIAGQPEGKTQ